MLKKKWFKKIYGTARPLVMAIYLKYGVVFDYFKLSIHLISAAIINSINKASCCFNGNIVLKILQHIFSYRLTT